MKTPLVSIIIPVYNTGIQALKLVQQLFNENIDIEIICVDDGSKDDSLAILENWAKGLKEKSDKQFLVFSKRNGGAASARNFGIRKANGEFILFIDSDDEIVPGMIKKMLKLAEKPEVDLVGGGFYYRRLKSGTEKEVGVDGVRPRRHETRIEYILEMLASNAKLYSAVNKLFKTEIVRKNHILFVEGWDFAEDTRFVLEYLAVAGGEINFLRKPTYIYNYGTDTSTVVKSSLKWSNWQKSYDFLVNWAKGFGGKFSIKTQFYLKKIFWRWKISHLLAVGRNGGNYKEMRRYLNPTFIPLAVIGSKIRK